MRARHLLAPLLAIAVVAPAAAQNDLPGRVGKLEGEMRAVQRKVFAGGAGQDLQPEVEAAAPPVVATGTPAASAVVDLTARVASLEGQMASLTGQVEQAGYQARQAQDALDEYRRATDARLKALEGAGAPPAAAVGDADLSTPAPFRPRPGARAVTGRPSTPPAASDEVGNPAPIARPESGDPAEDAYLYGYRLWQAKRYPEAETALKKAAADYPKARRYSYAQNLLGRTYLDDGKPSLASMAFYENYKKMPDGERAPESLFYLGQSLTKLGKLPEACKVYDELGDVYGAKLGAKMKADVAAGRATAKCR
ncbi:hypothetical protein [uncultured Sphingomonas sp.]|uniref:hypothetical protein n=1 Tax=uncultured Sphingomonas sp. TaxID=158754 RepID=UPI0035CC8CF5